MNWLTKDSMPQVFVFVFFVLLLEFAFVFASLLVFLFDFAFGHNMKWLPIDAWGLCLCIFYLFS